MNIIEATKTAQEKKMAMRRPHWDTDLWDGEILSEVLLSDQRIRKHSPEGDMHKSTSFSSPPF